MKFPLILAATLGAASPALANWQATLDAARGQTVYWNAWGGDERTNAFIAWVGEETGRLYGVNVEQVKLTDTAEAVTRVIAEKAAGNDTDGCLTEPERCAYPLSESGLGDGGSRRPVRRAALRVRRGRRSREDRGWDGRDVPAPAERDLRVGGSLSATAPHGIPDPAEHGEGEQSATDEREHRSVVPLDWLRGGGRRSGR